MQDGLEETRRPTMRFFVDDTCMNDKNKKDRAELEMSGLVGVQDRQGW